jgi:hypothetical protein
MPVRSAVATNFTMRQVPDSTALSADAYSGCARSDAMRSSGTGRGGAGGVSRGGWR